MGERPVTYYQSLLELNVSAWYEQDLSMQFIGPVLGLVQFTDRYKYNLFAGRKIQAVLAGIDEEIELSGEPDGMLATGYREPKIPMFAFTEYKKANDPSGEPPGQTLAAMLVSQHLNQTLKNITGPIYGAYIIGGEWWFMLLQDKEYVISRAYTALSNDLFEIFRILKSLKQIVIDLTR